MARYIVESYQNIPFLSVTAMAREIGVSDTTIIKYCMQLGFSGYGDFKRQVTNAVQVNADWHSRFEAHLDSVGTKSAYSTYETEVKNLQGTFSNPINQQNYEVLLDALTAQRRFTSWAFLLIRTRPVYEPFSWPDRISHATPCAGSMRSL